MQGRESSQNPPGFQKSNGGQREMSARSMKQRICSEKRREKSRNAARHRRSKETELFLELAQQLPLTPNITSHLDKASIMRLAISYMRLKNLISADEKDTDAADASQLRLFLDALEGFLMVVSQNGEMLFLSENVNKHLGLAQVDLIGQSLFEFIHPCDEEEIREVLHFKHELQRRKACTSCDFFTRMKCTWASQERSPNLKPASWKVLHCRGQTKLLPNTAGSPCRCMVLLCEPILFPGELAESPVTDTFLSRHTLDMKFTYCDERVKELLGYSRTELQGHSLYDYCHALDSDLIRKSHQNLLSKGQTSTAQYRMLSKYGGYVWIQTDATLTYGGRNFQPDSVVCMNYILSEPVETDVIFSIEQTECFFKPWHLPSSHNASHVDESDLLFTKFREHPEELAQLAPTPGDTIIMLDFTMDDVPLMEFPQEFSSQEEMLASGLSDAPRASMETVCKETIWPTYPIMPQPPIPRDVELSSKQCYPQEDRTFAVDYVEKLFASALETQACCTSQNEFQDSDLEMLAPYIPMEGEDFQLKPLCKEQPSSESTPRVLETPAFDTGWYQSFQKSSPLEYVQPELGKLLIAPEGQMVVSQEVMCRRPENGKTIAAWQTYQGHSRPYNGWPAEPWPPDPPFGSPSSRALLGDWPPILDFLPPISERMKRIWESQHRKAASSIQCYPFTLKRKLDLKVPAYSEASEPLPEKTRIAIAPLSVLKQGAQWFPRPTRGPTGLAKANGLPDWQSPSDLNKMAAAGLGRHLLGPPPPLGTLPVLNNVDCEVNAPLQDQCMLLQGSELLRVLDQVSAAMMGAMTPAF